MYECWLDGKGYITFADDVRNFVKAYRAGKATTFWLKDVQHYECISEAPVGSVGLLTFESECTVCGATFRTSRTLKQMDLRPEMVRTCEAHRRQGVPAPNGAWLRGEDLEARDRMHEAEAFARRRKLGSIEEVVMGVVENDVVGLGPKEIVRQVKRILPRGTGRWDNRKKTALTAYKSLARKGLVPAYL